MESRMDAGDIVACRSTPIDPETTAEDLLKRYLREAPGFLMESIFDYVAGRVQPRPQNEREATYCAKISKSDGLIDWSADAEWISRKIRAFNLWPVCHTKLDGKLLRIYRARLNHGDGISSDTGIEEGGVRGETEPGRIVALERENGIIVQTGKGCIAVTELQLEHRRRMSHGEFANGYRGLAGKLLGGGGSGEERKS
jgi:methionyl-tRNA formyltransferase